MKSEYQLAEYSISEQSSSVPNKRVQSDAAVAGGIGANFGYVTRLEVKPILAKSRRG